MSAQIMRVLWLTYLYDTKMNVDTYPVIYSPIDCFIDVFILFVAGKIYATFVEMTTLLLSV